MGTPVIEETQIGLSWTLEEPLARSSHALVDNRRVWLIDPTDAPEALDRVGRLGDPAGVIQLLDRHNRSCAALAARLGVPHLSVPSALPGTPFTVVRLLALPIWREVALWWPATATLVVAEAVGTSVVYAAPGGGAGVHPLLRLWPPRPLRYFAPQHLLVGHGRALHEGDPTEALGQALQRSRRDIPRAAGALAKAYRPTRT